MTVGGTATTETQAGRTGFRIGAGVASLVLAGWSLLTSLSGIFTLMPAPDDPPALVLLALLTAGVLALPAGIIVIAAAGWQPGLTMLVTHGVFSLVVTAVFFVMVVGGRGALPVWLWQPQCSPWDSSRGSGGVPPPVDGSVLRQKSLRC